MIGKSFGKLSTLATSVDSFEVQQRDASYHGDTVLRFRVNSV